MTLRTSKNVDYFIKWVLFQLIQMKKVRECKYQMTMFLM